MKFSIENLKASTINALSDEDLIHEVALGKLVVDEMVANRLGEIYTYGLIKKDRVRLENVVKRIHQMSNDYAKAEVLEQFVELGILEHYTPRYSNWSKAIYGTTKMRVEPNVLYYMQYSEAPRHGTAASMIFEGLGLTTVKSNVLYYATPYGDVDITNATFSSLIEGYTIVVKTEDDDIADYRLLTTTELSELVIRFASELTPDIIAEKFKDNALYYSNAVYFEDNGIAYADSKLFKSAVFKKDYSLTIHSSMNSKEIGGGITKLKNWT